MRSEHRIEYEVLLSLVSREMYVSSSRKRINIVVEIINGSMRSMFEVIINGEVKYTTNPFQATDAYNRRNLSFITEEVFPPVEPIN